MSSLNYDQIYSRFFTKAELYDIGAMQEAVRNEFLCSWLHSTLSRPYVNRVFASFEFDDENKVLTYEVKRKVNDSADSEFVIEMLATGMLCGWVEPKINSVTTIVQHMAESDAKFYSQAQHLSELRGLRDDLNNRLRGMIRDRGYLNNRYLSGTSPASTFRS